MKDIRKRELPIRPCREICQIRWLHREQFRNLSTAFAILASSGLNADPSFEKNNHPFRPTEPSEQLKHYFDLRRQGAMICIKGESDTPKQAFEKSGWIAAQSANDTFVLTAAFSTLGSSPSLAAPMMIGGSLEKERIGPETTRSGPVGLCRVRTRGRPKGAATCVAARVVCRAASRAGASKPPRSDQAFCSASIIAPKSAALREAPPTRAPSTFSTAKISAALEGFTEPP
ncbi:hypothetical protein SAMN04488026_101823 [Aliiruegeria lutimaris]|uniref:Uncharacterized protein n=1 Tax=Aliiruegeria lutimaris TaxID=571298 RepID=A0A1G8U162_9RHOB|nr:hypothetical protein SAMN04488026_101823 [Aliiruegeria lutimaris]